MFFDTRYGIVSVIGVHNSHRQPYFALKMHQLSQVGRVSLFLCDCNLLKVTLRGDGLNKLDGLCYTASILECHERLCITEIKYKSLGAK